MTRRAPPPAKGELQALLGQVFDGRTVCEACGAIGEVELAGQWKGCAACHAGCGVEGCRDAYAEARSPLEARLWRLGKHAQRGDTTAALAFMAALANYERAERSGT